MSEHSIRSGRTTASMLAEISTSTAAEVRLIPSCDMIADRSSSWHSGIQVSCHIEVLASNLTTAAPPGLTYIPQLDDILREARGSDSSTLRRGDMVELIGPSGSGKSPNLIHTQIHHRWPNLSRILESSQLTVTGKTTFCLFLLLTRLLPSSMIIDLPSPNSHPVEVPLGGQNDQATIIVPTSHRSPIMQLEKHIRSHITGHILDSLAANLRPRTITPSLAETIDETIKGTLSRLRFIRVQPRWKTLLLALMSVLHPPSLTIDPSKENTDKLDILIIDGFVDGFWPERWHTEDRAADKRSDSRIRGADDVGLKDVIRVLESIRKELGAVVVLTLQALWVSSTMMIHVVSLISSPRTIYGRRIYRLRIPLHSVENEMKDLGPGL